VIGGEVGARRARSRVAAKVIELRAALVYLDKTDQPDVLRSRGTTTRETLDDFSIVLGGYRYSLDRPDGQEEPS
jgi:hypothetical protein